MSATMLKNIGLQNMANVSTVQTQSMQQATEGNNGFSNILDAAKTSTQTIGQSGVLECESTGSKQNQSVR